jgi:hypothetical protein
MLAGGGDTHASLHKVVAAHLGLPRNSRSLLSCCTQLGNVPMPSDKLQLKASPTIM